MTGAIPPYPGFRREGLPYSGGLLASRRYVWKANPDYWVRSSNNSEHWFLFHQGGKPFAELDTFTAAQALMRRVAYSPLKHYPPQERIDALARRWERNDRVNLDNSLYG